MKQKRHICCLVMLLLFLASGCSGDAAKAPKEAVPQTPSGAAEPILPERPLEESPEKVAIQPQAPEMQYFPVIGEIASKADFMFYGVYFAADLTDIDGDGVRELLVTYQTEDEIQHLEIWTVRDGAPALLWKQVLYVAAGGPDGGVCRMQKEGREYLCIYQIVYGAIVGLENRMTHYNGLNQYFSMREKTGEDTSMPGMLKKEHALSFSFSGPDERTPSDYHEIPVIYFDGRESDTPTFQEWMTASDQRLETYLHVGSDPWIGHSLREIRELILEL